MRTLLLSIPFVLAGAAGAAQAMPNSLSMSCAAVSALVRQQGQAVIASGPNIFSRFVSGPGYCDADQTAMPSWIPSADQSQCLAGYHCQERMNNGR